MIIDLRSDTFTLPSPAMLQAMHTAPVGDDVFGEDPTVNKLQAYAADLFNMEAALFCPSGTMTNQIAIKCHTQPADEVICHELSHVYQFEGGGIAANAHSSVKLLQGDRGRITAEQVADSINNRLDPHKANTSLVSVENTCNFGGGCCYNFATFLQIKEVCNQHQLKLHLDGARLFNAIVANNESTVEYGQVFDSISICLSKGLGAPVGSLLLGTTNFIAKAKRVRKAFGGGMRQAGYLAAAGLYALQNNINGLAADHLHAKQIARTLAEKDFVGKILTVETNIIIFEVQNEYTPQTFCAFLQQKNILCLPIGGKQVRMVTHLNITQNMVAQVITTIKTM
jgi:threonine aldolase